MTRWRVAAVVVLALLFAAPLAAPLLELGRGAEESQRGGTPLLVLGNTLALVAGTVAVALPLGTAAAALLYRTDLPGRRALRLAALAALFVPLAVLASAWQAALGGGGFLLSWWPDAAGRPWAQGLGPAIWIHAAAAVPWVVLIVGQTLCWVEPELEEDALQVLPGWHVFWRVTLPRCRAGLAAAALWVALQTAGDASVAELMQLPTFAEQILYEFQRGGPASVSRAIAHAVPVVGLTAVLLLWGLPRLERALPALRSLRVEPRLFRLGPWRWPALAAVLAALLLVAGVPLASLVWKAGLHGTPLTWSADHAAHQVLRRAAQDGLLVGRSVALSALTGGLVALAALVLCWLALDVGWFRRLLLVVVALAWALPGPVVGVGLKELILTLVAEVPFPPLQVALYYGPSPLPVLWAHLLRFLPCAVVVLWPVLRLLPRPLRDSARLDCPRPSGELRYVVWPLAARACGACALVVMALSLGEVSALAVRVETPGWPTFALVLFDRMHYGVANDVAALCLLLLALLAGAAALVVGVPAWFAAALEAEWEHLTLCR
jgi:iron(III) transport system permease protein